MLAKNKSGWKLPEYIDIKEQDIKGYKNITSAYAILKVGDRFVVGYNNWRQQWEFPAGGIDAGETARKAVESLDIELIGLEDIEYELPSIIEDGKTPLENAEIKARAYYDAFHIPVFSCDSGLYFEELQVAEQPGLHVRRANGKELSDDEMIQHYTSLAKKYGGRVTGQYRNAIYFILDENHHYSSMDMSIATEPFILGTKPHLKRVEGFPLDSLSIDIKTGKYYYDLEVKDVSTSVDDGVREFFRHCLCCCL